MPNCSTPPESSISPPNFLKRATVITPNVPEAEILTGMAIKDVAGMEAAARKIVEMGAHAVIVKGGHMERAVDVLFDGAKYHATRRRPSERPITLTAPAALSRPPLPRCSPRPHSDGSCHARQGLRHQSHRERATPSAKGRHPLDHFYRHSAEPPARGIHEVPQHGMHPAAEPTAH